VARVNAKESHGCFVQMVSPIYPPTRDASVNAVPRDSATFGGGKADDRTLGEEHHRLAPSNPQGGD
jgi:hypothetical protein